MLLKHTGVTYRCGVTAGIISSGILLEFQTSPKISLYKQLIKHLEFSIQNLKKNEWVEFYTFHFHINSIMNWSSILKLIRENMYMIFYNVFHLVKKNTFCKILNSNFLFPIKYASL